MVVSLESTYLPLIRKNVKSPLVCKNKNKFEVKDKNIKLQEKEF